MNKLKKILFFAGAFLLPIAAQAMCDSGAGGGYQCGGGSGKAALLLVTAALGYGVLVLAKMQTKPLNTLGKWVGGIILVVSALGLLCAATHGYKRMCMMKGGAMCPFTKKMACPMSGGSDAPADAGEPRK